MTLHDAVAALHPGWTVTQVDAEVQAIRLEIGAEKG